MTYEELLVAVQGRVSRFASFSDPEDLLDSAGTRDIDALWDSTPERHPAMWHAVGMLHYARQLARPATGERQLAESMLDRVRDDFPEIPAQLRTLDEAATRPVRLNPQRVAVLAFAGSPLDDLNRVIFAVRHQIRSLDPGDPQLWRTRMDLVDARSLRFRSTGHPDDLDATIATCTELMGATARTDPNYPEAPSVLGGLLQLRFVVGNAPEDLDASVEMYREALATSPETHENRPMHQANLGRTLALRHAYGAEQAGDLDDGLELLTTAVATTPGDDPAFASRIGGLQEVHVARFHRDHNVSDLDRAVALGYDATNAPHVRPEDQVERILTLAAAHMLRHGVTHEKDDVVQAKSIAKKALKAVPRDHPLHTVARDLLDMIRAAR